MEPGPTLIVTGHLCADLKEVTVTAEKLKLFSTTAPEALLLVLAVYYV